MRFQEHMLLYDYVHDHFSTHLTSIWEEYQIIGRIDGSPNIGCDIISLIRVIMFSFFDLQNLPPA